MSKPKKDKAYKEAVAKMTAVVDRMNSGAWQGSSGLVVHPTPVPQPAPQPAKRKR